MPTAARAIRLAFGFVGRYSGTTGALARSMHCDACVLRVSCVPCNVLLPHVRMNVYVPYHAVPGRTSAPTDEGQISISISNTG